MNFKYARACKWRVVYIDDRIPEDKQEAKVMIFFKHASIQDFFDRFPYFTIKRITIKYEYPTFDQNDRFV